MSEIFYVTISESQLNTVREDKLLAWCEETFGFIGDNWGILSGYIFVFHKEEDVLMFSLKVGNVRIARYSRI